MKALALLLLPALAWAQAVRYDEAPVARARPPLAVRIDELVGRLAKRDRREIPRADLRLDAAMTTVARLATESGAPPNELVQGALWVQGIVEPPPQIILATLSAGDEEGLLKELAHDLPAALAAGRYARVGVGLAKAGQDTHVIVALQESFVDLDPIARAQPLGAIVTVRGRLHDGFERPETFVTAPDGKVTSRVPIGSDRTRFGGTFRCAPEKGRYQIEVTGEDRFGATVVANFPVWCGVPAPMTAEAAAPPRGHGDDRFTTTDAAEQTIFKLLNADRAHAGLAKLAWSAKVAAVARAHSADMAAHGFFGHVSPTTGTTGDRVRKAGLDAMVAQENVARAATPGEVERGLMNSPGHRANILSREATEVGVGVVLDPATKELLVTQLFIKPPERFGAHTADELRRAIAELRRAHRLRPLERDAGLDDVAQSSAEALASGRASQAAVAQRISGVINARSTEFTSAETLFAVGDAVARIVAEQPRSLTDPAFTTLGLGVAPGATKQGGRGLYVVVVLATRR